MKELLSKYSDDFSIKIIIDDNSSIFEMYNLDLIQELPGDSEEIVLKGVK